MDKVHAWNQQDLFAPFLVCFDRDCCQAFYQKINASINAAFFQ
jgi:hypothetical protein